MRRTVTVVLGGAVWFAAVPANSRAAPTEPESLTHPLASSGTECGMCHAFANPASHADAPNHSPIVWQGSAMAHSARDPVFWAALALAGQDHPEETIDCVRCHVPNAFLSGRGDVQTPDALDPADLDGIGCDLCHRMVADPDVPLGNARYTLDDTDTNGTVAKAGPWSYELASPNHPWREDLDFLPSSDHCGVCHDVTTARPRLDDDGTVIAAGFNEQRTYSEWANSAYAREGADAATCQECHMPAVSDVAGCAAFSESGELHATGGRRHDLAGAHQDLTLLMRQRYGSAGSNEIDDAFYDATLAAQQEISARALRLTVDAPAEFGGPDSPNLSLTVTLENLSGHKLPTGYSEGRVMWIEVDGLVDGVSVVGSGRWQDGEIEADPQVRRYEGIAERLSDGRQNHLLLNDHWRLDTRLPPKGLTPALDTDPVTDRYALTPEGTWSSVDTVTFDLALPDEAREALHALREMNGDTSLELHVRVRYLINTPAYLTQLREDNVTNLLGEVLAEAYASIDGPHPVTLAAWSAPVEYLGVSTSDGSEKSTQQGCGCHATSATSRESRMPLMLLLFLCTGLFGRIRPNGRN